MMKESESEIAQLCPILYDPMDCSLPGSSIHGIFQARVLEWGAIAFSRGSSQPRDQAWVSCIADRHFTVWSTTCLETWAFPSPPHIATTPSFILWISTVKYSWNSEALCICMSPLLKLCGRKVCCWLEVGKRHWACTSEGCTCEHSALVSRRRGKCQAEPPRGRH